MGTIKKINNDIDIYPISNIFDKEMQAYFVFKDASLQKAMNKYKWTHSKYKRR